MLYPGVLALGMHRIAHWFFRGEMFFIARFVNHLARLFTAIDIHPGAKIGRNFFIDHGFVVIGETAEIHDNVTIYQGATLGGTNPTNGMGRQTPPDDRGRRDHLTRRGHPWPDYRGQGRAHRRKLGRDKGCARRRNNGRHPGAQHPGRGQTSDAGFSSLMAHRVANCLTRIIRKSKSCNAKWNG